MLGSIGSNDAYSMSRQIQELQKSLNKLDAEIEEASIGQDDESRSSSSSGSVSELGRSERKAPTSYQSLQRPEVSRTEGLEGPVSLLREDGKAAIDQHLHSWMI